MQPLGFHKLRVTKYQTIDMNSWCILKCIYIESLDYSNTVPQLYLGTWLGHMLVEKALYLNIFPENDRL